MGGGFPPHIPTPRTQNLLFPNHNYHAGNQHHHHNHHYHTQHRPPPHHRLIPRLRPRSPDHQNHIRQIHTHHRRQIHTHHCRPPDHKQRIRHVHTHHRSAPPPPPRTEVRHQRLTPLGGGDVL